jgi:predicted RNA-binding protein
MGNSRLKRIELNEVQQELLIKLPETGMGYQLVDITMKDGSIYQNKTIINGQFLEIDLDENIRIELIEKIEISNTKKGR